MSNYGRQNSSQGPAGFVYFNSNVSGASSDGSESLSQLNNSYEDNKRHGFSPSYYSSPKFNNDSRNSSNSKQPYRHSPKGNNWGRSSSYNSSGDSYQRHRNSYHRGDSFRDEKDMSAFFDPTCLQDPWEELVRQAEADGTWREIEEQPTQGREQSPNQDLDQTVSEDPTSPEGTPDETAESDSDGSSTGSSDDSSGSGSTSSSSVTVEGAKT